MDPGTALAVASLAIQLAGTVQTINEFLRTIRDAPSELVALIETMDLMQSNLNQVNYLIEQQFSNPSLAGSPVFILNALRICERRVGVQKAWVEEIKTSLTTRRLVKRTWATFNIRPKKTQLSEMHGQIKEAMANLHFAVTNNQWHIQLQQVQMTTASLQLQVANNDDECRPELFHKDSLSMPQNENRAGISTSSGSALRIASKQQNTYWYQGVFGVVTIREKWISTRRLGSRADGKPVPAQKVLTVISPFLRRAFELYFDTSFSSVPRALRVYQMVNSDAPIFTMCREGDIDGVQTAIANGTYSPFIVDHQGGRTLLHVAALFLQPDLCALLLRLGLDPDRACDWGKKALVYPDYSNNNDHHRALHTVRTLAQAQDGISSTEMSKFITSFRPASLEIVEYILSLNPVQDNLDFTENEEEDYPALGAALRKYGAHIAGNSIEWDYPSEMCPAKWESIIRKLLHIGVDVHAPVPRSGCFEPESYPCTLSPSGTPLDELFTYTENADESKDAADAWLHILSTEGIDVSAYLEKEATLHATRPMFTCPQICNGYLPRQLIINIGESPSVYADWWIDPKGSISLIRQEFKDTDILNECYGSMFTEWGSYDRGWWKIAWPFCYPRWRDSFKPWIRDSEDHATWERLNAQARERADRRWQKKARKEAWRNCSHVFSSMPGAWPE